MEDWLESVYGMAVAPVTAVSEVAASLPEFHELDKPLEQCSMGQVSASGEAVLASRPRTSTDRSPLCDVDTEMVERKVYRWRKWRTESV